jgi:uracil-DNA glycosylase
MTCSASRAIVDERPETALRRLRVTIQSCTRCEALARCRSRVVPGDGIVPADVVFVGIAPGRFGGDRTGIPFSGDRSGHLLRLMISRCRLKRVFITNLVRCNPRDAEGRNRDPTADEVARCRDHLRAEFAIARPRVVACLGRMAWYELAGRTIPFTPRRGKVRKVDGILLFPMYHPAFVNRGAYSVHAYARDFARLARFLNGRDSLAEVTSHHSVKGGIRFKRSVDETSPLTSPPAATPALCPRMPRDGLALPAA